MWVTENTPDFPNWFDITAKENFETHVPKDTPLRVLQVGVYTGDATEWLITNRNILSIDDVDTWRGSKESAHDEIDFEAVHKFYLERVKRLNHPQVHTWHMTSNEFFHNIEREGAEDRMYDLIYIDGDHTASQTAVDGLNAFKYLDVGGLIVFDDLTWQSGKGEFFDPRIGIEAVFHVTKGMVEPVVANSQLWLKRVQ